MNTILKRKRPKKLNTYNFNTIKPIIHDEILQGIGTMNELDPMTSSNKSKMVDGGHIEFRKMLIFPYWMNFICTKFGTTCNTTRRCSHDHRRNRKLYHMTSSVERQCVILSDYARSEPNLVHNSKTGNHHGITLRVTMKIQDGCGRHITFRKNVHISGLNGNMSTKFAGQVHHGHVEMIV